MPTSPPVLAYVTDLEGQWERLTGFLARSSRVRLEGERLVLADDTTFVFGGDAIDRGPWSRRIVRTLLDAKERYGERVVLLGGNRDLNKMRLVRELDGFIPARIPEEFRTSRPTLLRWIFARSMGAPNAFELRAAELAAEHRASDDEAVVDSFLEDLAPDGPLTRYLAACQLGFRAGETLFLHGGLTTESLGHVPDHARVEGVGAWVEALNAFCRASTAAFRDRTAADLTNPAWGQLIAYQAPTPGKATNPASVVYGRLSDDLNNPALPSPGVIRALAEEGIRRLVLGHTPSGDTPAMLRTDAFELVVADNSRGRIATGSSVEIDGAILNVRGRVALDSGEESELACRVRIDESAGPLGLRTRGERQLVKGFLADGRCVLFRGLPGYQLEQVGVAADALDPAMLETASNFS